MNARPSTSPLPITTNFDIEATINGYRWIFDPGASRVLNWSVSGSNWNHPSLQSAETQGDFRTLFDFIGYYVNVTFNFLGYFDSTQGRTGFQAANAADSNLNITFAYNATAANGQFIADNRFQTPGQTAFCFFPSTASDAQGGYAGAAGDTWLNWNNAFIRGLDFEVGTQGFGLLLHEVLHGLGLKHPHDSGATGRPTYADLNMPFIDRQWVSVMSYDRFETGGDGAYSGSMPIAPMIMDVIALQYLYGESLGSAGNSVHDLSLYSGIYYNTLWDHSGVDLLNAATVQYGLFVNLGLGKASNGTREHEVGFITTALDALSLAVLGFNPSRWTWLWGEYENFNGSSFADTVTGSDGDNTLNGGDGDDLLIGGAGNDTFDWDPSLRRGADTFRGGPGNDYYVLDSPLDSVDEVSFEGIDTVFVGFNFLLQGTAIENLAAFTDLAVGVRFTGSEDWGNELTGGPQADTLIGLGGDDTFEGSGGNDFLDGGSGLDTAVFSGLRSGYALQKIAASWSVSDRLRAEGVDSLFGVERLAFSDFRVALDTDALGRAGQAAQVMRALFGPASLSDRELAGIGIGLMDRGYSYDALVALAVDVLHATGIASNTDYVRWVYQNVVGVAPDPATLSAFVGLLNSGQFSQVSLGTAAAQATLNVQSAELVGLAASGLEFVPWSG